MYAKQQKEHQIVQKVESLLPEYKIVEVLGTDQSKLTFKVTHVELQVNFILKLFTLQKRNSLQLQRIIKLLKEVSDCPHLLTIYEVTYDTEMTYLAVIEDLQTTSLKSKKLDEQEIWGLLQDLCSSLQVWHKRGVAHCRVKPGAIFKERGQYILGEPDIPYMLEQTLTFSNIHYQSLEVLNNEAGLKSDVFSIGVIVYELMNGTTPFRAKDIASLKKAMISEVLQLDLLKLNKEYSHNLNNLCLAMLCIRARGRPALSQVHNFVERAVRSPEEIIPIGNLLNQSSNDHYIKQLAQFLAQPKLHQYTEEPQLQPYTCMTKAFFRPGKVRKPNHHPPTKQHDLVPELPPSDFVPRDSYQLHPFLMKMPDFLSTQDIIYAQRFYKKPKKKVVDIFSTHSQDHLTTRETFESTLHTSRVSLPKIKKTQSKYSERKEVFLHEVIKKYMDRQEEV